MKTKNLIIILGLALMISYCKKSPTESGSKPFLKTLWTLDSFDISGKIINPPEDQVYNIRFLDDGTFHAKSDCNEIIGHFIIDSANSLNVDSIVTTKVYCGTGSMYEKYYEAIGVMKSYEIANDRLNIYYGNNEKLNFQGE